MNELKRIGLELLFFKGNDCGLCDGMVLKTEDELSKYNIPIIYVDLDKNPMLRGEYGVFSFPTLLFLKDGVEIERVGGFFDLTRMIQAIKFYSVIEGEA